LDDQFICVWEIGLPIDEGGWQVGLSIRTYYPDLITVPKNRVCANAVHLDYVYQAAGVPFELDPTCPLKLNQYVGNCAVFLCFDFDFTEALKLVEECTETVLTE